MTEPPRISAQNVNSERIKQIAQVIDAMGYLNAMIEDGNNDEVSVLLDSMFKILNITYSNLKEMHLMRADDNNRVSIAGGKAKDSH